MMTAILMVALQIGALLASGTYLTIARYLGFKSLAHSVGICAREGPKRPAKGRKVREMGESA